MVESKILKEVIYSSEDMIVAEINYEALRIGAFIETLLKVVWQEIQRIGYDLSDITNWISWTHDGKAYCLGCTDENIDYVREHIGEIVDKILDDVEQKKEKMFVVTSSIEDIKPMLNNIANISQVYKYKKRYYSKAEGLSDFLVSEYMLNVSSIDESILKEHGELIIKQNAKRIIEQFY